MGAVLDFRRPCTVEDAWEHYLKLINERTERQLWTDIEHNKRIVRAWDDFAQLYLESEAAK